MSCDLKKLKNALDEQIPMPELKKDLLLRAQASRPKSKSTFAVRVLTTAAAVVLIVLSLSSMLAPILTPHIDDIGNNPYTTQQPNNPAQDEGDAASGEPQYNPEIPEGFVFNPSGIGSWAYMTLAVSAVYFVIRIIRKARRREAAHMLLTEIGFLVYIIALIVLAYRPMIGQYYLKVDAQIWRSNGVSVDFYGQQLYPANLSVQGAYINVLGWSLASAAFTASLAAAYSCLRKRWAMLFAFAVVLLVPWAWKVLCIDMTAAQWLSLKLLVLGIIPLAAVLTLLATPAKRKIDRYARWCSRFEDANAYGRVAQGVWWVLAAAAVFNLFIGSWWGGQQIFRFDVDVDVQYGITENCDEAWFEEVNRTYALYKEQNDKRKGGMSGKDAVSAMIQNPPASAAAVPDLFEGSSHLVESAVRLMYHHGIDELTPDMLMTVKLNADLETARPYHNVWMKVYPDNLPLDVIWDGYGGAEADEVIDAYCVYLVDAQQTERAQGGFMLDVGIAQYHSYALDFRGELDRFAVPRVYTAQFHIGLEDETIVPENINAKNIIDIFSKIVGVIVFVLICLLIDWRYIRKSRETYLDDEAEPRSSVWMRRVRCCLAALLILLLITSWCTMMLMVLDKLPSFMVSLFMIFSGTSIWLEFSKAWVITQGLLISAGLTWSIVTLLSPAHKHRRHWMLIIYLSLELLFYLLMIREAGFVLFTEGLWTMFLPSAILIGIALFLALVQNIYYKFRN